MPRGRKKKAVENTTEYGTENLQENHSTDDERDEGPRAIIGDKTNRCRLCPDGAEGKPLLHVKGQMGEPLLSCQRHAGFYGYSAETDIAKKAITRAPLPHEEVDDSPSTIKMKDR